MPSSFGVAKCLTAMAALIFLILSLWQHQEEQTKRRHTTTSVVPALLIVGSAFWFVASLIELGTAC